MAGKKQERCWVLILKYMDLYTLYSFFESLVSVELNKKCTNFFKKSHMLTKHYFIKNMVKTAIL